MSGEQTQRVSQTGLPLKGLAITVVEGPDQGKRCSAQAETITVGTATDNDLALTDPAVSRYHLELSRVGDWASVRDVGSTNGTFIGTVMIARAGVPPGTRLVIGRTTLEVSDGQNLELELHPGESLGPSKGAPS